MELQEHIGAATDHRIAAATGECRHEAPPPPPPHHPATTVSLRHFHLAWRLPPSVLELTPPSSVHESPRQITMHNTAVCVLAAVTTRAGRSSRLPCPPPFHHGPPESGVQPFGLQARPGHDGL
jgi:hypothetical protein